MIYGFTRWTFTEKLTKKNFSDIIPTDPEDNFPHQVVRICYSTEFKDAFDYFRAISEKGELSERALQLTADCIKQNAANYTGTMFYILNDFITTRKIICKTQSSLGL